MEGEDAASEDFLDSNLGMEEAEACAVLVFGGGKACVGSCSPGRRDKREHTQEKYSYEMCLEDTAMNAALNAANFLVYIGTR